MFYNLFVGVHVNRIQIWDNSALLLLEHPWIFINYMAQLVSNCTVKMYRYPFNSFFAVFLASSLDLGTSRECIEYTSGECIEGMDVSP